MKLTDNDLRLLMEETEKALADAQRRQENPGDYALLHANGMKWADLVAMISGDAILVDYSETRF